MSSDLPPPQPSITDSNPTFSLCRVVDSILVGVGVHGFLAVPCDCCAVVLLFCLLRNRIVPARNKAQRPLFLSGRSWYVWPAPGPATSRDTDAAPSPELLRGLRDCAADVLRKLHSPLFFPQRNRNTLPPCWRWNHPVLGASPRSSSCPWTAR